MTIFEDTKYIMYDYHYREVYSSYQFSSKPCYLIHQESHIVLSIYIVLKYFLKFC